MPARDIYHNAVVRSLKTDGWTITHDPLHIAYGGRDLYINLGAERDAIAAEKDNLKIAVEIKSFMNLSPILDRYRNIVRKLILDYAIHKPANGQIEVEAVIDSERDHYEVVHVGWDGVRRVHGSVIHIDIIADKVWIQYDGTSQPVAETLLEAGIPHEEIVLGFHPAELRQYTDFAIS